MRIALLLVLFLLSGCTKTQRIDRATLDQRYEETQLTEGVLSIVPLRIMPDGEPPVVVNWWYAGSSSGDHQLIFRQLTWDQDLVPVGAEQKYVIAQGDLLIKERFARTSDAARWVPLYEAASNEIEPPADLPTARKAPGPITNDPIKRPEELAPPPID
ncbi:MAG: hypothetical protein AAGB26_01550 [Planctomycetota bacterium]